MENQLTDIKATIKELCSLLIILQQGIQNDEKIITLDIIDDSLEIIIPKAFECHDKLEKCIDKHFANIKI